MAKMMASDLIQILSDLIDKYGDVHLLRETDGDYTTVNNVFFDVETLTAVIE